MHQDFNEGKHQRYVDLMSDSGFKAVFGDKNNKDVVMSVLNMFLPEHRKVSDIEYKPTEYQGPTQENKEFRYDFLCTDSNGASFIVELERGMHEYWFRRCVSYASRIYDLHNRKGGEYDIQPVYLIGLMGTGIDHPDKEFWKDRYISEYTFREKECHDLLDETIIIIFAELTKFRKKLKDCENDLERMLFLLRNMSRLDNQPEWMKQEVFTRFFQACEIARFDKEKLIEYETDMDNERYFKSLLNYAEKSGLEKGREEGREEGLAEGREEGMEKGMEKVIRALAENGMSAEQICAATGLDKDIIEKALG